MEKDRQTGMQKALRYTFAYGCGSKKLGEILAAKADITSEEADGILSRWMKSKGVTPSGRTIGQYFGPTQDQIDINKQSNTIIQMNFAEIEARVIADAIKRGATMNKLSIWKRLLRALGIGYWCKICGCHLPDEYNRIDICRGSGSEGDYSYSLCLNCSRI